MRFVTWGLFRVNVDWNADESKWNRKHSRSLALGFIVMSAVGLSGVGMITYYLWDDHLLFVGWLGLCHLEPERSFTFMIQFAVVVAVWKKTKGRGSPSYSVDGSLLLHQAIIVSVELSIVLLYCDPIASCRRERKLPTVGNRSAVSRMQCSSVRESTQMSRYPEVPMFTYLRWERNHFY